MGAQQSSCCLSAEERASLRVSLEIDRRLRQEKRRPPKAFNAVLLGMAESGRSTFIKQMRILYGSGYTQDDRKNITILFYQNIYSAVQTMIRAMERLQISYSSEKTKKLSFLNGRMIDIVHHKFVKSWKWIESLEITSLIFLAALSDYDQVWEEYGDSENHLEQSKSLFRAVISHSRFRNLSIILFLNKKDVLEEKIMYSHLITYFSEFTGPKQDAKVAQEFILELFQNQNQDEKKVIYSHFTCATDREYSVGR